MIDDMAPLIQAMDQMDAEDPTVAQAGKDRAALILNEAKLSFAKLAELIQQRRLLLQPAILARIKRMDQPGMLGDAAFRDTGSALRKEGQSFRQIAEAIEASGRPAPRYENLAEPSTPLHQIANEPFYPMTGERNERAWWVRALVVAASIGLFPLRHPIRFLVIALLAVLLFYGARGVVAFTQQVATLRHRADIARSLVSFFVNGETSRPSEEAAAPPVPPAPIPSPSAAATSLPSATPSAAPATAAAPPAPAPSATASVPSASESAAPAAPAAAPAAPSAPAAGPPASTSRRDARSAPPSKPAGNCCAAREDHSGRSHRCAPSEDERCPRVFEDDRRRAFGDDRRRVFEDMVPEAIRRNSRVAGPCIGGVGGCYWGGGQH